MPRSNFTITFSSFFSAPPQAPLWDPDSHASPTPEIQFFSVFWRPSGTVRSALAPVAQAASVLERGAELALRAQVWVGGWWRRRPFNQAVPLSLSLSLPRLSFRLVMPGSGCRLQRACVLLVAGGETWKQQTKKERIKKR